MTTSQRSNISKKTDRNELSLSNHFDELLDNFRSDMENAFFSPFFRSFRDLDVLPSSMKSIEARIPLCDVIEKDDKYNISLEVPGIKKDKIEIKGTKEYLTVSGIEEENKEEKDKEYVLNERSFKSFYRKIPFNEEIIPTKVSAKVEDGILKIDVPKQKPRSLEETNIKIN